ncbi:MAG: hypothetical protein RLN80_00185 [Rhodospirillales bacterium]
MRVTIRRAMLFIALIFSTGPAVAADAYRGMTLLVAPGAERLDRVVPPADAIKKIRAALDLIYRKSPLNARLIDRLKEVGTVVLIYDPQHAESTLTENRLARFQTETGIEEIDRRTPLTFVAVLGKQVMYRDANELAGTIVHEVVGHGTQHRVGRLARMTVEDRECEARLFQLAAWQDLGVPQRATFVIQFRRSLEHLYCLPFRKWMAQRRHAQATGFDQIRIQPLELATAFRDYIDTVLGKSLPTSPDR